MSKPKIHEDMKALASAINHALVGMYGGAERDFLLVVASPAGKGEVTLNSITGMDAENIAIVGNHLLAMARAQKEEERRQLDPGSNGGVQGHA